MASILKVDQLQKPDGSTPTAADLGIDVAGSVLQVISHTHVGVNQFTSGTSFINVVGYQATIIPKSSTSKILVTLAGGHPYTPNNGILIDITRNGIRLGGNFGLQQNYTSDTGLIATPYSVNCMDSPNTTGAVVYQVVFASRGGTTVCADETGTYNTITLTEIAQ